MDNFKPTRRRAAKKKVRSVARRVNTPTQTPPIAEEQFKLFAGELGERLADALRKTLVPAAIDALDRAQEEHKRIAMLEAGLGLEALWSDLHAKDDRIKNLERERDECQAALQEKLARADAKTFIGRLRGAIGSLRQLAKDLGRRTPGRPK